MIPVLHKYYSFYRFVDTQGTDRGLGPLYGATECLVTEELNGDYSLELKIHVDGLHVQDMQIYQYIETSVGPNHTEWFRITMISRPLNGIITVHAVHAAKYVLWQPVAEVWTAGTAQEVLEAVKQGIAKATYVASTEDSERYCPFGHTTDGKTLTDALASFSLETDITKRGSILNMKPRTLQSIIFDDEESFVSDFGAELEYRGHTIRLLKHRGNESNTFTYRYSVNITDLTDDLDSSDCYACVLPYYIPQAPSGENQEYEKPVLTTAQWGYLLWESGARTVLYDVGNSYNDFSGASHDMTEDKARSIGFDYANTLNTSPVRSIEVAGAKLANQDISLGDTVHVIVEPMNLNISARITKTVWNALLENYDSVTIGTPKQTLSQTIKKVANS